MTDQNPNQHNDPQLAAAAAAPVDGPPWEEIEPGRFMPRRVRGSFRGQALG
jgi:hypothetical protein